MLHHTELALEIQQQLPFLIVHDTMAFPEHLAELWRRQTLRSLRGIEVLLHWALSEQKVKTVPGLNRHGGQSNLHQVYFPDEN